MTDKLIRKNRLAARGFSLLEVILALAILAGSMTLLGQLIWMGNRNAIAARDLSYAQLLCESKMDEFRAGLTAPSAVTNATFDTDLDWTYSVETAQTDEQGILSLRVTVTQNLPYEPHPVQFALVSWISDSTSSESSTDATSTSSSETGTTQ